MAEEERDGFAAVLSVVSPSKTTRSDGGSLPKRVPAQILMEIEKQHSEIEAEVKELSRYLGSGWVGTGPIWEDLVSAVRKLLADLIIHVTLEQRALHPKARTLLNVLQ